MIILSVPGSKRTTLCDQCGKFANPALSHEDPRALAQTAGWVCNKRGDYCPKCWEEIEAAGGRRRIRGDCPSK